MDEQLAIAAEELRAALEDHEPRQTAASWERLCKARRNYTAAKVMARELCNRSPWP